jgi:hypothetical protein
MPTPQRFIKNVLLWVDDIPKNNLAYLDRISPEIEIIQLKSTIMT